MKKFLLIINVVVILTLTGCAMKHNTEIYSEDALSDLLEYTEVSRLDTYFWMDDTYVVVYLSKSAADTDYANVESVINHFFSSAAFIESYPPILDFFNSTNYKVYLAKSTMIRPKIMDDFSSYRSFEIQFRDCENTSGYAYTEVKSGLCMYNSSTTD